MFSKKSSNKLRRSPFLVWQVIGLIVIGITLSSMALCLFFVYQYLYNTLDEANSIVVLRSSPDLDEIEGELYNKTQQVLTFKQATSTPALSKRNMFTTIEGPSGVASSTLNQPAHAATTTQP